MAKQDDLGDKAINIGIFAAVCVGLYFLYKWLKNNIGGAGGSIFGGSGTTPGGAGTGSYTPPVAPPAPNVASKIATGYNDIMAHPSRITRLGIELSMANVQAQKFAKKAGSNIVINKILKAVNALPDADFMAAIGEWQKIDNWKNFNDTLLANGLIYTGEHSTFLTKYYRITGVYNPELKTKK